MTNRFHEWPDWTHHERWTLTDDPENDRDESEDAEDESGETFEVDDHPPDDPTDDPTEGEAGPYGDDIPF